MTRGDRWQVSTVATLGLVLVGVVFATPELFAVAVLPLGYVVYGAVSAGPASVSVAVDRTFDPRTPTPGEEVAVELTLANTGSTILPDVRVIDGVPDELAVTDGHPRGGMTLRPGETATITYRIVAKQGEYTFDTPVARFRSVAGGQPRTVTLDAGGDQRLICRGAITESPTEDATIARAGVLPTDTGGSGVEFHSTREYHPGDALNRINWRQYAKTNSLTTVDYNQEQAGRFIVGLDVRRPTRRVPAPGYPTGAELCGYAGERTHHVLTEGGHHVSVAAVGLDEAEIDAPLGADGLAWIPPDATGGTLRPTTLFTAIQTLTQSDPATAGEAAVADGGRDRHVDALLARCPPDAALIAVSPLLDEWPVAMARQFRTRGYPVTLISPDPTTTDALGQQLVRIDRSRRLRELEQAGVTTVDWDPTEPFDLALRTSLTDLMQPGG